MPVSLRSLAAPARVLVAVVAGLSTWAAASRYYTPVVGVRVIVDSAMMAELGRVADTATVEHARCLLGTRSGDTVVVVEAWTPAYRDQTPTRVRYKACPLSTVAFWHVHLPMHSPPWSACALSETDRRHNRAHLGKRLEFVQVTGDVWCAWAWDGGEGRFVPVSPVTASSASEPQLGIRPPIRTPPSCDPDRGFHGTRPFVTAAPGVPLSLSVVGTAQHPGARVTLAGTTLPTGAAMTPTLPTAGSSPARSTLNWIPTSGQSGRHVAWFSVTDGDGLVGKCQITIVVVRARVDVTLDIGPVASLASVDVRDESVVPVAILNTPDFNPHTIDPTTVTLGDDDGADTPVAYQGDALASGEDVDRDGDLDVILQFEVRGLVWNSDLNAGTTELILNGETADGILVKGRGAVLVASPRTWWSRLRGVL